jgi:hypothetical protein
MFSSGVPRGALWLIGGILATILVAIVNEVFHEPSITVTVGVVSVIAFGLTVEPMIAALKRRASSFHPSPEPVEEVHAGDRTS